jgi:hypothetical protein
MFETLTPSCTTRARPLRRAFLLPHSLPRAFDTSLGRCHERLVRGCKLKSMQTSRMRQATLTSTGQNFEDVEEERFELHGSAR